MKRIISFLFLFSFIFCLTGCNSDLENRQKDIEEENLKIENVLENYNNTIGNVDAFNYIFMDTLTFSFDERIDNYGFNVSSYIDSIHKKISQNCETVRKFSNINIDESTVLGSLSFEFIPFLVQETGEIEEYIFINGDYTEIVLIVYWDNGKINDIMFE